MMRFFTLLIFIAIVAQACIPSGRDYGKELYETKCANCHGIEGDGLQQLYPPLKNSDYLVENQADLACLIRYGVDEPMVVNGVTFHEKMPATPLLSEVDIHNIINYIHKNINPNVKPVKIEEVTNRLIECQ